MNNGWLELESDPGLFTLLLEDFGVPGVQVEEIYDLQKPIEGPVYGFIFLFKWIEERRSRRKITHEEESFVTDENVINSMFFAQQVIPNSCATHALISVLLNCDTKLKLGDMLSRLREFTRSMSAEDKGLAIGNMPDLAKAHNSHARPEPRHLPEKQQGISTVRTREAFHFVSYVPVNGRLFELDGLKPHPIDHGPWFENEEWTEKFRRVITERLGMATGGEPYHDIRFNLMAVVPDRRQQYEHKLETLKTNRRIVLETLQKLLDSKMVKVTTPEVDVPSVMTRQMKSKEAANAASSKEPQSPQQSYISLRTRTKQKAAAAAANASSTASSSRSNTPPSGVCTPRLPAALDSHNYAKSPILEGHDLEDGQIDVSQPLDGPVEVEESDMEMETNAGHSSEVKTSLSDHNGEKMEINQIQTQHLHTVKDNAVKIEISVSDEKDGAITMPTTVAHTDVTKPLIIQTKFACSSPGPGSESTDTASEIGSAMHSPVCSTSTSSQNSPNVMGIARVKSSLQNMGAGHLLSALPSENAMLSGNSVIKTEEESSGGGKTGQYGDVKPDTEDKKTSVKNEKPSPGGADSKTKFGCHQGFTPKDLLALLKNVENEISICENNLRDEVEKRKKYKIDDCRRTHNYDQFICTFLSMLAEQGQLAGLVEQHMLIQRRQGVTVGKLHKNIRKTDKRKKAKTKKRK